MTGADLTGKGDVQSALDEDAMAEYNQQTAVAGLAGLAAASLPDDSTVEAMTASAEELSTLLEQLSTLASQTQLLDGALADADKLQQLRQAVSQLADPQTGLPALAAGAEQLYEGTQIMAEAVPEAAGQGVPTLNQGMQQAYGGLGQIIEGIESTDDPETEQNETGLISGAGQVSAGSGAIAAAIHQLEEQGMTPLAGGASSLADGADQLYTGSSQVADGLGQLDGKASLLSAGVGKLASGASQVADGAGQLADGSAALDDGVQKLVDDLKEYNEEGIQKLVGMFGDDLTEVTDRIRGLKDAAVAYNNYAGAVRDDNNSVRFIFKTAGIGSDEED